MSLLSLNDLSVSRGATEVLRGIDLRIGAGEFVGLIGPNGAGKTTLLRAALGLLPARGQSSLAALTPRARARAAAFIPQGREIAWPLPVSDLVALGRDGGRSPDDLAAVERAIAALDLGRLRDRPATALSGGEQARTLIARALAQEAPLLIADEPAAGLDPAAQISLMQLFARLARQGGSVLASLHDLGLAARHCSRLIILHQGRIAADGHPLEVLSEETIARVFGITAYAQMTAQGFVFQPVDVLAASDRKDDARAQPAPATALEQQ